ncbi:hypothetical protein A9995_10315 [Erythrobacter sp. QSSC1-22B]|uniref:type II toxin-antitoxin system antitoxin SocA domain-containing protein n=1 Tax=Erythrobacter sp. QSSC1-22B TaxID=1860125 RepID=UPI0008059CD0|nr:type II toxin-antitoxin system antitoxin SocA domain-containing protein [Erythrobacter sp. QSSC1-22B]OBX18927.1 hypothetical protein A9995_10315 [Erythrobacter sp. QSSC1-22B]
MENQRKTNMQEDNPQPLLRLPAQSEEQPRRSTLTSHANSGWQRIRMAIASILLAISKCLEKIARMAQSTKFNELLSYVPKRDKVVEGALWLLERAPQSGGVMTTEKLSTVMFLADKAHLDAYGRPVFFDNYVATENGPEGVAAMEMLDANYNWTSIGSASAPWTLENANGESFPHASRSPNMRRLSETDVEALESAMAMVTALDADQLRLFTHRDQAYAAAWNDGKGAGSRLDPRLIPDTRDDEMIDDLLYASRHAYIAPSR